MNDPLQAVERYASVGLTPPQLLRLPGALRRVARALARLALVPLRLVTGPQRHYNEAVLLALRELAQHAHALQSRATTLEYNRDELYPAIQALQHHQPTLLTLPDRAAAADRRLGDIEAELPRALTALTLLQDQARQADCTLLRHSDLLGEHEVALEEQQSAVHEQGLRLRQMEERLEGHLKHPHLAPPDLTHNVLELQQAVARARDEAQRAVERLRAELMAERSRVSLLLEEVRRTAPGPRADRLADRLADDRRGQDEDLYAAFEERFRGSREEIMGRQQVYLPLLKDAGLGTAAAPVIDLGCGRGEWLELLRDNGLAARGVDLNRHFLATCRERGLAAAEGDAVSFLASLPDCSVGAVTGFHIVEHLPLEGLLRLLGEAARVLKPGGVAIFETPNPENLAVGACHFYSDPTHKHPIYPPTLEFLVERQGLVRVEVRRLNGHTLDRFRPADPGAASPEGWGALFEAVKHHFLVPPDYAVIGWKA
jgi:O-antigen chain-terminating methyltransferase